MPGDRHIQYSKLLNNNELCKYFVVIDRLIFDLFKHNKKAIANKCNGF